MIHSGIEVNFNMMHVKYDLIYHSIHFYRWDSLCYLTEVKKKKKIIIKVHVFSIRYILKKNAKHEQFFFHQNTGTGKSTNE